MWNGKLTIHYCLFCYINSNNQGEFVFKNGRNYEGEFEDDKVKEFPNISLSGRETPDLKMQKTQQSMMDGKFIIVFYNRGEN